MKSLLALSLLSVLLLPLPALSRVQGKGKSEERNFAVELRATPGLVNIVDGKAQRLEPTGERRGLVAGQALEKGDRVVTEAGGYVELLLHPGCYLRLAGDSEVIFLDLTSGNLKLSIQRGAVLFEILRSNADMFWTEDFYNQVFDLITVITPQTQFGFAQHGIYRFDVSAAAAELEVRKGEAVADGFRVTDGKKMTFSNATPRIQKLERTEDAFDIWSRNRAAVLASANKDLSKEEWHKASRTGTPTILLPKAGGGEADSQSTYKVSAVAGQISFIEDGVSYRHSEGDWQVLTKETPLKGGDTIRTGEYSRAEIALSPQAYLRINEQSEIGLTEIALSELILRVEKGEAILQIWETRDSFLPNVKILHQQSQYLIKKQGSYRFGVGSTGRFEARVREGEIEVLGKRVKGGKRVRDDGEGPTVSSFDEDALDSFDLWNRERNEFSVVANQGYRRGLPRLKANRVAVIGVWYHVERLGFFTFLPTSSLGFQSPYGDKYPTGLGRRRRR